MRALVISGGGSKGAFAGGVAQYLMKEKCCQYDLLLGTSTGSLLIPHLALGNVDKIHDIYTNVNMSHIFDVNPFVVKHKNGVDTVGLIILMCFCSSFADAVPLEKASNCDTILGIIYILLHSKTN